MIQRDCRIRINGNGILLFVNGKFVPCTPDEATKVLRNVTRHYPKQKTD